MFDANMRGLPKGKEFFAEVHYISKALGDLFAEIKPVKSGDILLCTMLGDCSENPKVLCHLTETESVILEDVMGEEEEFYDTLFVYSGNKDLTGFIQQEWLDKAKKLLEERDV